MTVDSFELRRAWPRASDLVLELVDSDGVVRAGCRHASGRLEVSEPGYDRALPGLPIAVRCAGSAQAIVAHRLGRRAVVRSGGSWIKVVRPAKVAELATTHTSVAAAVTGHDVAVAPLGDVDEQRGLLRFGHLPGLPMLELADPVAAAADVAAAIRRWRAVPVPAGLGRHDVAAEITVLAGWAAAARDHGVIPPGARAEFDRAVATATASLAALGARPLALCHRDLHDEQLLVAGRSVGILDLDTAARGDPALDVGNLVAHVELAAAEKRIDDVTARHVVTTLRLGAGLDTPEDRCAVTAYRDAARVRLAAVHAFRSPARAAAARSLLPRITGVADQ